ncbi:YdcF family protein, partial [Pseudomonas syringae pv. tagetis]
MPLRYILKNLLLPPGILFVLLILGCWLRRSSPRLATLCFAIGLGGLWMMSLPVAVEYAARKMEQVPTLPQQQWET